MVDPDDDRYQPTTVLIVVDVQNDFADAAGGLRVAGGEEVVPVLNREIAMARAAGALVVYTQDWHPLSTPHFAKDGGIWPVHCIAGSWGAALHPGLVVDGPSFARAPTARMAIPASRCATRARATVPTELATLLAAIRTDRVLVGGLATDYCVKATALDATRLGHPTAVLGAAIRAVDLAPGDGERALAELAAAGVAILAEASR